MLLTNPEDPERRNKTKKPSDERHGGFRTELLRSFTCASALQELEQDVDADDGGHTPPAAAVSQRINWKTDQMFSYEAEGHRFFVESPFSHQCSCSKSVQRR